MRSRGWRPSRAGTLRGQAFLDFPVNRTGIYPDYRKNPRELAAIRATIDSVRQNPYASIAEVSIKGYASPEGSYANNERLAKGRAEALLNYIRSLYDFGDARMTVDYEPEDWKGLERAVAEGDLADKEALLAIIRDPAITDPDRRDARLKTVAGGEPYRHLPARDISCLAAFRLRSELYHQLLHHRGGEGADL